VEGCIPATSGYDTDSRQLPESHHSESDIQSGSNEPRDPKMVWEDRAVTLAKNSSTKTRRSGSSAAIKRCS